MSWLQHNWSRRSGSRDGIRAGVLWLCLWALAAVLPAQETYQKPPTNITEILNAPLAPVLSFSPTRDRFLLVQGVRYPSIAKLAEPSLRLAGQRINPLNNGPQRAPGYVGLAMKTITDDVEKKIVLPPDAQFGLPLWSPDGKQFAFALFAATHIQLWVGDAMTGTVRRLNGVTLNAAHGETFQWLPDSQTILCQTVVPNRGPPPVAPKAPPGPMIQESNGKPAPVRTFQDLLENAHDEALFDYYATAQLQLINSATGQATPLGQPAIVSEFEPSPDGLNLLVVRLHRPYSYQLPSPAFPRDVEIWNRAGKVVFKLASLPLQEEIPIGGVQPGPRNYHWRPTALATLVWVEALDGGDPKQKATHRDRVLMLRSPFQGMPEELVKTEHRFSSLMWGEKSSVALLKEYQSSKRWNRTYLLNLDLPDEPPRLLWDLSAQERYNDPGTPMTRTLPAGQRAMRVHDNSIYLNGAGASPEGDRPFLDRLDLATLKTERLFQCDDVSYESVVVLVKEDASQFITRRESASRPPNYFLRSTQESARKTLTNFPDSSPQLRGIKKQLVTYERNDGVQLSFTLYLPADYKPGTRLPTVLWAYPREFSDADTAGQISGSPHRFTAINGISHLFLLTQGYAILDGATMPVVGDAKKMNDTYLEQIVASARAAIDKAVEMGVTDPQRVGVGGHSYGAFMTANLLAHSDLFRAGIARSGAYNRTLTPFGFQNERRTLWEAPDMYLKVSPLMYADKIKEPLLILHGDADNNPGTFTLQSERLFQAIKGNGGTARLVLLPHEAHAYEARESVEHTLYEMVAWFDKYVKNAPPRKTASGN